MEIFRAFLALGLTSFGGPVAHLGYMRREFVSRRGWLDEGDYAQLLAICQFLPGPSSSQMGFAIGLLRGGWCGALAAFAGFTLPSALLMFGFAYVALGWQSEYAGAATHGLKLVAVAVVAHAVIGMARQLTPDMGRRLIAIGAVAGVLASPTPLTQLVVIGVGAVLGQIVCRRATTPRASALDLPVRAWHAVLFGAYAILLALALLVSVQGLSPLALFAAFYRTGALVFGGGHVVLPLLQEAVVSPGWVSQDTFLAGYGAAQAVPGPMFSLAAFLGASTPLQPVVGAAIALAGIFLPGFLLLGALLPVWSRMSTHPRAAMSIAGANAAVVGVLAAAFYNPVWIQGVRSLSDALVAGVGLLMLLALRRGAPWAVLWCTFATTCAYAVTRH
jgi:chromate transporter